MNNQMETHVQYNSNQDLLQQIFRAGLNGHEKSNRFWIISNAFDIGIPCG